MGVGKRRWGDEVVVGRGRGTQAVQRGGGTVREGGGGGAKVETGLGHWAGRRGLDGAAAQAQGSTRT